MNDTALATASLEDSDMDSDTQSAVPPPSSASPSLSSLFEHPLLSKEQEAELGRALQTSAVLQRELRRLLLEKQKQRQQQATNAAAAADDDQSSTTSSEETDWDALMGRSGRRYNRQGDDFNDLEEEDDDDEANDDLYSLSVIDSASWYQQSNNLEDDEALVFDNLRTEENVHREFIQDRELEQLTDSEIQAATNMSRLQVQSVLLEGAIARDTFIRSNTRLVVQIAKKWAVQAARRDTGMNLRKIYQGSWDRPSLDEAIQEGIIGLISAVDRYEPERNLKFSTYATYYITDKVRRCFRLAETPAVRIPYNYYDMKLDFQKLKKRYYSEGKELPPLEDVAKELGVGVARFKTFLRVTQPVASLDAPKEVYHNARGTAEPDDLGLTLEDEETRPEDWVELSFLRQALETAMANELTPIERDILRMRLGLDDGISRSPKEMEKEFGGLLTYHSINSALNRAFRKLRSPQSLAQYKLLAYLDFVGIDASATKLDL